MAGDLSNAKLGQWTVAELIGAGATAEVYRAVHGQGGQQAALKVAREDADADSLKALEREAEMLAKVEHASVPRVLRAGDIRGRPCLLMTLFEGRTLHRLTVVERTTYDRIGVFRALIAAVAACHGADVIHADLKLENVVVGKGRIGLLDFGTARLVPRGATGMITSVFRKRVLVGTPTYLAPELLNGRAPTPRSDVWALGVCAWLMFAHRPHIIAADKDSLLRSIRDQTVPPIASVQPLLPKPLAAAIDRCLQRDTRDRWEDGADLASGLAAIFRLPGLPPAAEISRALTPPPPAGGEQPRAPVWLG